MLMRCSPNEVYRRVDFDARVAGASPEALVGLCYEQLAVSLSAACHAHAANDPKRKSASLTRALSALTALEMGVDASANLGPQLLELYSAARKSVLDSVLDFDANTLSRIRQDFIDIMRAVYPH